MYLKSENPNSTTLLSETSNIRTAFVSLIRKVESVSRYVDDVVAGKIEPDRNLGRFLLETMESSLIPETEEFQRLYSNSVQDYLMAIYISNLMRSQLHLTKKLESLSL